MKLKIEKIKLLVAVLPVLFIFCGCEYQAVADATYPDQSIYMPVSKAGVYTIDNVAAVNAPFRYEMDSVNNKINIPLGIYRSGINNSGDILVDVKINNDTVLKRISEGTLIASDNSKVSILPADKYVMPETVQLADGKQNVIAKLAIDVPFLLSNPDKLFAVGVTISSNNVKANSKLNTTIVLIDTKFVFPKPNFTFVLDSQDSTKVVFTNTSLFSLKYTWDFGDGSPAFTGATPPVHKYDSLGIYNLKLTAKGATGTVVTLDSAVHLWKNITKLYIPNPGDPFLRSDNRAVKTGNLKDWNATSNVQPGGFGGYYADLIPVMDFFSTLPLKNAKIYRSFDLPKGIYKAGFVNAGFKGTNDCYFMVALGDIIPDVEAIPNNSNVLASYRWNTDIQTATNEIFFKLENTQRVTIGFLVNNTAKSEIKIRSVFLYR